MEEGGLEYLLGYMTLNAAGEPQYIVIRLGNQAKRGEYYQLRDLIEQNAEVFKSLVK